MGRVRGHLKAVLERYAECLRGVLAEQGLGASQATTAPGAVGA